MLIVHLTRFDGCDTWIFNDSIAAITADGSGSNIHLKGCEFSISVKESTQDVLDLILKSSAKEED